VFIGTKAQYIKTALVLKELDKRNIAYNLIDSGQHGAISQEYREYFNLKNPDRFLIKEKRDIKTVWSLLSWFIRIFVKIIFGPKNIFHDIFQGKGGICLIHGDTPTTLISALASKRCGIKLAHLESGLRSFNIFHPFPEEIIRIWVMRLADYLFAPNQWCQNNLIKMKIKERSFLICGNTNIDALQFSKSHDAALPGCLKKDTLFVIFSVHRVETILNRNRLKKIVNLAKQIAHDYNVLFCLHPPTKEQLRKFHFYQELEEHKGIYLKDLLPYPQFIQSIKQAYFVVTDGGSVQEESYFLNAPCLLMRNYTERIEGLQKNVYISEFKDERIQYFLKNIDSFRTSDYKEQKESPSAQIVDILLDKLSKNA
jgi:UDP-N-acetylglucosamine 2-epimerase